MPASFAKLLHSSYDTMLIKHYIFKNIWIIIYIILFIDN